MTGTTYDKKMQKRRELHRPPRPTPVHTRADKIEGEYPDPAKSSFSQSVDIRRSPINRNTPATVHAAKSHAHKKRRATLANIINRIEKTSAGAKNIIEKTSAGAKVIVQKIPDPVKKGVFGKAAKWGVESGAEYVSNLNPILGCINAVKQFRQGVFDRNRKHGRGMMLTGASDLLINAAPLLTGASAAVVAYAGYDYRNILAVCGAATAFSTARATSNYVNHASKFVQTLFKQKAFDAIEAAAEAAGDSLLAKKALIPLGRTINSWDRNIRTVYSGLREKTDRDANPQIWEKLDELKEVLKLYANCYDPREVETLRAMRDYLADPKDRWNLYIIRDEKTQKPFGFFTAYTIKDKNGDYHFLVEQVVPPQNVNKEINAAAWKAIRSEANKLEGHDGEITKAKRMWFEFRKDEPLPEGFMQARTYHQQPPLQDQTEVARGLRMAVHRMGNGDMSGAEYFDVVYDKWMKTWYKGIENNPKLHAIRDRLPKPDDVIQFKHPPKRKHTREENQTT
jgi:hypothetical protein